MAFDRTSLLLMAFFLCPVLAQAQVPAPDLAAVSAESTRPLRAEIETVHELPAALNGSRQPASDSSMSSVGEEVDRTEIINALVLVLVLSLVFESAMSVIFDWRLFIRHFEGRGVKTPFIIGVAFLVFLNYDLDIVSRLLAAFPNTDVGPEKVTFPGQVLTALLIAGGSSGVFRIFSRLGIRSPEERDRKAQKERASQTDTPSEESSGRST